MGIKENLIVNDSNHLTLHGLDLVNLSEKYGTPLFIFDEKSLTENFERFKKAFEDVHPKTIVAYSIKTNNNLALCKLLRDRGAYAEVSSELDLHIALKAGYTGDKIIYDGPFKPVKALEKAVKNKVFLINCESFVELERLNNVAERLGVKQAIGLRINTFKRPSFLKTLHPKTLLEEAAFCFPNCRFGFSPNEAVETFKILEKMKNLRLNCLMTHPYREAVNVLTPLFKEAYNRFGFEIKFLNIGGGFTPETSGSTGDLLLALDHFKTRLGLKSNLDRKKHTRTIEEEAKAIVDNVKRSLKGLPEPVLIAEPGRYIVGPSCLLLLKVDHVKFAGGYKWVFVDGGTNIIPTFYDRRETLVANNSYASEEELVNIVGPLLYPKDFIAIKTRLPKVKEGDVLAVLNCGAYSLASSTQFLYPRPAAVMVNSNGNACVIREKETFEEVIAKDSYHNESDSFS